MGVPFFTTVGTTVPDQPRTTSGAPRLISDSRHHFRFSLTYPICLTWVKVQINVHNGSRFQVFIVVTNWARSSYGWAPTRFAKRDRTSEGFIEVDGCMPPCALLSSTGKTLVWLLTTRCLNSAECAFNMTFALILVGLPRFGTEPRNVTQVARRIVMGNIFSDLNYSLWIHRINGHTEHKILACNLEPFECLVAAR